MQSWTANYLPEDVTGYYDLLMDAYELPTDTTSYVCQSFTLPEDEDLHAVAFEVNIPNVSTQAYVHHAIVTSPSFVLLNNCRLIFMHRATII